MLNHQSSESLARLRRRQDRPILSQRLRARIPVYVCLGLCFYQGMVSAGVLS